LQKEFASRTRAEVLALAEEHRLTIGRITSGPGGCWLRTCSGDMPRGSDSRCSEPLPGSIMDHVGAALAGDLLTDHRFSDLRFARRQAHRPWLVAS
jgi:hypothetical protein